MNKKIHIMILSAGSLLGQNILDSLETRRDNLYITGLDATARNPRIFRCDNAYKCPLLDDPDFKSFVLETILKEQPDVILPARDHDVYFLAELSESNPELREKIIAGSKESVLLMNDKSMSYEFCKKYNLLFAKSFVLNGDNRDEALIWARSIGYPILGKPSTGFGSLGIRILSSEEELNAFLEITGDDFMLQEVLDFSSEFTKMLDDFNKNKNCGIPLFYHVPVKDQYAAQVIIEPDGTIGRPFTSINTMVIGRCEASEVYENENFTQVVNDYAKAIANEGWRGVFNLQVRKVGNQFIGHEMNGRMSGSTSARRLLGYDEVREAILRWNGIDIGVAPDAPTEKGIVLRSLTDYFVPYSAMEAFERDGYWKS